MSGDDDERQASPDARQAGRVAGVRPVRRPVSPGSDEEFDLYYVRSGRKSAHPLVIIPGGPGVASVQPYRGLRRRAAAKGLDVIMVEHRGVGMSRHDDSGADLPPEAITVDQVVDDVAAVLDDAGVEPGDHLRHVVRHLYRGRGRRASPGRVRAMILDSPLLSTDDIDAVREAVRGLLLEGSDPETAELAAKIRRLVEDGVLTEAAGQVATMVYSYGGAALLDRQLDLLLRGRTWLWSGLAGSDRCRRAQGPVPQRDRPRRANRVPRAELWRGTRWPAVGPGRGLARDDATSHAFRDEPYDLVAECRSSPGRRS